MKTNGQKIAAAVMATLATATMTAASTHAAADDAPKCYGIAKAGKNACGTPTHEVNGVKVAGHACAGQATVSFDCYEWLPIPKAPCNQFVVTSDTGKNYSGFTSPKACLTARGLLKPTTPMEKCYGIAKKGDYLLVPKGDCLQIKGGSLSPMKK